MKFSLKWLNDFIDTRPFFKEPENLSTALTQAGLEVDSLTDQKDQFKNVVVAEILSVEKHPQADRLTLCKVSSGKQTYSIVCGAKNHKKGDKVVLALPGAVLPKDFHIKKTRIRGVDSEGMLASREELGFESSGKEEGIIILDSSAKVGESFAKQEGLDDIIFDISIPPNRPDCLSHKGLAREISCLFSLSFSEKPISVKGDKTLSVKKNIKVEVKDKKSCPRYCGRLIEGVEIKESPPWLKARLKSLGLKSINNVVDITNFVLWDRGQPLHAFDKDKIQSLSVERSQKSEKFLALDENELTLTEEELTIRDGQKVLALAGVIGGMDSSITEKTQNVFIESAGFAPERIRKTARRLGLETDSSYRFTRGIDLNAVAEAMDLACSLIVQEAGGKVSGDCYDFYEKPKDTSAIKISLQDLEERLGYKLSSKPFINWMKGLGCVVKASTESFQVLPPSYRQDLKIKEDLIEEFARLEGYHKVPETFCFPNSWPQDSDPQFLKSHQLINSLSGKGFDQAINYSFCDPTYYKEFLNNKFYIGDLIDSNSKEAKQSFSINNPISQQLSLMKPLLTPDLVKNAIHNSRRNNKFGQIFELSPVFYQDDKGAYKQEFHLALLLWGKPVDIWNKQAPLNVYVLKSVLESLFESFRLKGCVWKPAQESVSFCHPKQSLILNFQNKPVGFLASLHPQILQKYKIPLDLAVAEIQWEILDKALQKPLKFKAFSNLLTVEKDLSFVIPLNLQVEDVRKEIKKSLGSLCEKVEIFDIYEKKEERSVSFKMYLKPEDKSWTDEQLQAFLNKAIQSVYEKFSIKLKQ